MVQQLSLVSHIPKSQFALTISTLKAMSGMSPLIYSTHTLLTKPMYDFKPKVEPGKINQIEQYFMKVITTWDDFFGEDNLTESLGDKQKEEEDVLYVTSIFRNQDILKDRIWTLQISDIPSGGKRTTSSQTIYESIITNGDLTGFLPELGYQPTSEYWIRGVRFFHSDIIIEITRIYVIDKIKLQEMLIAKENAIDVDAPEVETAPDSMASKTPITLLDKSGQYLVKCYVNVPKLTDVEGINKANNDLNLLKKELRGLFELDIPDRMVMDSRVLNRNVR